MTREASSAAFDEGTWDALVSATQSVDSFLASLARITASTAPASFPPMTAGAVIADRYRLTRPLGRGAHGAVWEAHDALAREDVAVKLLSATTAAQAAGVRREVASLRRLRHPGVIHLLDEGLDGDRVFLVMPIVRGRPFPGASRWEDIALPTELLLETLAQVHAAGMVHRDLKPANVLVGDGGRPVVLDFGLSRTPAFEAFDEAGKIVGTPLYLAPEQILDAPVDARADLYAVGVMLHHALTGRPPHDGEDVRSILVAKLAAPPAPLRSIAPSVPDHVARAVDALLATSPDDRPGSAIHAIRMLRGEGPPSSGRRSAAVPAAGGILDEERLRALFAAPGRLSWVRDDAARVLHDRTGGDPEQVNAQIDAWVRAGWCRWEDDREERLVIDRDAVDRLEASLWVRASPDDPVFVEEAIALARRLAETGRLGNAVAALHEGLSALRREAAPPLDPIERLLALWVRVALAERTPAALDRVLYEICRTGAISPRIAQLEGLVRAALAVGAWTFRALELATAVPPFEDVELEVLRHDVRVAAARRTSLEREEAVIAELDAWASSQRAPEARAAFSGWLGRLRYRQGRYDEAAALHAEAAASARWLTVKASSLLGAASALMEAYRMDEAAAVAAEALAISHASRHAHGWAHAEWAARTIAHRRGEPLAPDRAWIDAVAELHIPELEALACMNEAAIGWRAGDTAAALALALRAKRAWSSVGESAGGLLLVSALAVVCGDTPDDVHALAEKALACDTPSVGIQVLGLLAAWLDPAILPPARVRALALTVPEGHWGERLDIVSVGEAMERLRARDPSIVAITES